MQKQELTKKVFLYSSLSKTSFLQQKGGFENHFVLFVAHSFILFYSTTFSWKKSIIIINFFIINWYYNQFYRSFQYVLCKTTLKRSETTYNPSPRLSIRINRLKVLRKLFRKINIFYIITYEVQQKCNKISIFLKN